MKLKLLMLALVAPLMTNAYGCQSDKDCPPKHFCEHHSVYLGNYCMPIYGGPPVPRTSEFPECAFYPELCISLEGPETHPDHREGCKKDADCPDGKKCHFLAVAGGVGICI